LNRGTEDEQADLKKLHFFEKWLECEEAPAPDNINWANLKYKSSSRCWRITLVTMVSLILTLIGMLVIVNMKD
jgi:hypothetical protein